MKWDKAAEEAMGRVPFFVRKRVRAKVEAEASAHGAAVVTRHHVRAAQEKYLNNMEQEIKGYKVETCFGPSGCPNRAVADQGLAGDLEEVLARADLLTFLKGQVAGPLKFHHEFRVSVSDCPNACSRPQIADLSLLGARRPKVGTEPCSGCGACVEACREGAVTLAGDESAPTIDHGQCLACGQCLEVCPTGTLVESERGYRVQVGGRLGRHPQLARELPGIFSRPEVLQLAASFVRHYQTYSRGGERWGDVLNRVGYETLDCLVDDIKSKSGVDC
jgi:dissimilatory sulfite reductase (desulfoviridin) alpha/beta subunit